MPAGPTGTKAERAEATRAELVRVARELFTERGYGAVGTEEIVRRARVTRGALYRHCRDKRDLFRAVHRDVERELAERVAAALDPGRDPFALLVEGMRTFLDACTDPAVMRISILDAPAVLGWREWRDIGAEYGLGIVVAGLRSAMDVGAVRRQPVEPLAHLILGALSEAGMLIANASDPRAAREEVEGPLLAMLGGLRA